MKKIILIGFAIFAVSTSAALAAKKPKEAASASPPAAAPMLIGQVSAADKALYMKNKHDSGMK
jgi:hypothetical protein